MKEQPQFNPKPEKNKFIVPTPEKDESREEYLDRVRWNFVASKFPNKDITSVDGDDWEKVEHVFSADKEIIADMFKNLESINSSTRQSFKKDVYALEILRAFLRSSWVTIDESHKDHNMREYDLAGFFEKTMQHRNVFSKTRQHEHFSYLSDSYMFTLLSIPDGMSSVPEVKKYMHSIIDNKIIYLFGGGHSAEDLVFSKEYNPKQIINIDPYITKEEKEKHENSNGRYRSVTMSAANPELPKALLKEGMPQADQIWASFSVPFYLNKSQEIADLFKNIQDMLAPDGYAHLYPFSVPDTKEKGENFETRKRALILGLQRLMSAGKFNVSVTAKTIHIHRLP